MLSYRHNFHAGNHADVLKHATLTLILSYFQKKQKSFWYIDTHAGVGKYDLTSDQAQKNKEFNQGIGMLYTSQDSPDELTPYINQIKLCNGPNEMRYYPGSPFIANHFIGAQDQLRLFELHPTDFKSLTETLPPSKNINILKQDGLTGLKSCLPPQPRRGITLIDPSYEVTQEYKDIFVAVKDAVKRFQTGTYMIWCPLIDRREPEVLLGNLKSIEVNSSLYISLSIDKKGSKGMYGSYLYIINPPWTLRDQLSVICPYLVERMGIEGRGSFDLTAT